MESFGGRWWVSGGLALELFVGRSWRDHDDTDIGILRDDPTQVRDVLNGWDIHVASRGILRSWHGEPLLGERDENNLWCRPSAAEPWALDLTLNAGDDECWTSRRDPTWRVPWTVAVLHTESGTPYLSPDLQLAFKSKNPRPKDHADAHEVVPELTAPMKEVLRHRLTADHPWQALL
jgi:hypothetical protein